jgi:anti-sigma B factor antagonist
MDMALEIAEREREGIALLDLKGRIVAGPDCAIFRAEFERLDAESKYNVILNLLHVDFIDSTGLGAVVVCASSMKKKGGNVKLLDLNKRNIELLVVTRLTTMFEIFDDEQDAVNSFFPGREIKTFDILSFVKHMKEE